MLVASLLLSGCVHTFQPMSGLYDPVVVDPTLPNLQGQTVSVRCIPKDYMDRVAASNLCQKVGSLFENQGATVTTSTSLGESDEDLESSGTDPGVPADLTLQLSARKIHATTHPLSWIVSLGTFTLVPAVSEVTFAQDVEIRDNTGFLLAETSLQGRIVRYFGAGTWAWNNILDAWKIRKPEDRLSRGAMNKHMSENLYGQLSQLMFNAKIQREVLDEGAPLQGRR
jgi:hypothetical protein